MDIIEIFKDFHKHPELSYQEFRTTKKISEILTENGVEILPLKLETGLVAIIRGGKDSDSSSKKTFAFRCDIDALPVKEETLLDYKSVEDGKMHACGHDIHISTGIKVAVLLNEIKNNLDSDYLVIFQSGEESSNGALKIIETGILKNVEAVVALHVNPELEAGVLGIKENAVTSSVDKFKMTVTGIGAHGAKPENSIDPILAASHFITSVQSIVSRNVSPLSNAVVSMTHFESGHTWNIIPEKAFLEGTIRTSDSATRNLIEKRFTDFVHGNDVLFGTKTQLDFIKSNPATNNDSALCKIARRTAEDLKLKSVDTPFSMVGEDFAYFQEITKGVLIWVGCGVGPNLHSPKFMADYNILNYIPEYFVKLLLSL